jgi:hypothetical protein
MEQAITNQAQTTKALAGSLEVSREVVSTVMGAHQHSIARVETLLQGMLDVLTGQLEALRMQVDSRQAMLSDPVAAQSATFMKMSQDWMEAYGRLMNTASGSFRPEATTDVHPMPTEYCDRKGAGLKQVRQSSGRLGGSAR